MKSNMLPRTVSAPEIRRPDQTMSVNPNLPSSSRRGAEIETSEESMREKIKNARNEERGDYSELFKALERKDWKEIEDFVSKNPAALSASIKEDSGTLFHLMADYDEVKSLRLMETFVGKVSASVLEKKNSKGWTPLFKAAFEGNIKAAKILVRQNENLPNMKTNECNYPIHAAAWIGHRETVEYLRSVTEEAVFAGSSGRSLVRSLINSHVIDVAFNLLKHYPKLAREDIHQRGVILRSLASKPKIFESGCRFGFWKRFIYGLIPVRKERVKSPQSEKNDFGVRGSVAGDMERAINSSSIKTASGALIQKIPILSWNPLISLAACCLKDTYDTKSMHIQSAEIVRMMCAGVNWNFDTALEILKQPILTAAKLGIHEIVNEVLYAYSSSLVFVDGKGNNARMLAVLHRREELFRILREKTERKKLAKSTMNISRSNILHMAGESVPSSEVASAALQMQRELQWFKAVEDCYDSSLQEHVNLSGQTPEEVFRKKHKALLKDGETWMRETARSYSIVVSLIITAVFAAAFNVPGGRKSDEDQPILLHDAPFIVFMASDALALFFSTTSLLMFLRILTSRYAQEDFLKSLPNKLMWGLLSMFFSIVAMMVTFGATVYIVLSHLLMKRVIIPVIAVPCCIPIILFAALQFPFLFELFSSTYRPSLFQPLKIRMEPYCTTQKWFMF